MNELIQIIKLMEQAPNFSTIAFAVFTYCLFRTIKSIASDEIDKKMDKRFNPIINDITEIKKDMILLKQNICPKNGL